MNPSSSLRGVNWSGLEYSTRPVPESDMDTIASWGANVVRLPFNQEWALTDPLYLETLDAAIAGFGARNIRPILDLQWIDARFARGYLDDGRPNYVPALPNEASVEVWRLLSARYKTNPNVIYDIFNEPHNPLAGDDPALPRHVTPEVWAPWARRLVEAIRQNEPNATILVPGVNWAYDLSGYPLAGIDGVVYSTHVYPSKGTQWDRHFGRLADEMPVFAGEWGGEDQDLEWGERLAQYLADHRMGWTAWSWNDWPNLMQAGRPTRFGELVRGLLTSW